MITILKPKSMGAGRLAMYKGAWTAFARKHGEEVMHVCETAENKRRILNDARRTNGRLVVVRPEFIPSPTFFDELDYMRGQRILIVLLRNYRMYFNPGENHPYKNVENGLSKDLMVFQLSGQTKFNPPPKLTEEWLEKKKSLHIARCSQSFLGDSEMGASVRSTLGEVIPGICQTGSIVKMGCFCVGGDLHYARSTQTKLWRAAVEAMSIWNKIRT